MADFSFGFCRDKSITRYTDQTILNTPIPVGTSTVDKKAPEPNVNKSRLMRLEALRSRASWISNMETPKAAPRKVPLADNAKNLNSEASHSSSSKATTGRKSSESFQSILNLQTMDDLSGSLIDANMYSEAASAKTFQGNRETASGEEREGNKENTRMPCVGLSPGDSLREEEDDEVLRVRHDSADVESFQEELTLNWDEITRPPSPPVNDKAGVQCPSVQLSSLSHSRSSKPNSLRTTDSGVSRSIPSSDLPSRLLVRTAAVQGRSASIEASSSSQRRLESILASDNSELSSASLSNSGVRRWMHDIPVEGPSSPFRFGTPKCYSFGVDEADFQSHQAESIDFGSIRSMRSVEAELERLQGAPSDSWLKNIEQQAQLRRKHQATPDFQRLFVPPREGSGGVLSSLGLSSGFVDSAVAMSPSLSAVNQTSTADRMPSIREEDDVEDVTLTDENASKGSGEAEEIGGDKESVEENKALSLSALRVDDDLAAGQPRGVRGHPLASSTVASLAASMATSDDGSSLVNLSDIKHALDNDLWESNGPSGVASFVERQARAQKTRKREVEKQKRQQHKQENKKNEDASTIRASSGETIRPSVPSSHSQSPVKKWVTLRESLRTSPPSARPAAREDFVELAASTLDRSHANGFVASLASSQATAVKVGTNAKINRNNNNTSASYNKEGSTNDDTSAPSRSSASEAPLSVAQLLFPAGVTFAENCLSGCQTERTFALTNGSQRAVTCQLEIVYCVCNGESLEKTMARRVFPVRPTIELSAGTSRGLRVFFKPHRAGVFAAELRIVPDHCPSADIVVNLSASAEAPRLRVLLGDDGEEADRRLDFGSLVWGGTLAKRLMLMNEGQADLPLKAAVSVSSRLALHCFGIRSAGGGECARQMDLSIKKNGGCAELELLCRMPQREAWGADEEETVLAQAALSISLQGISQEPSPEPLASVGLRATAGTVRLSVPRHLAVVHMNEHRRSANVPLRNEGSLPASVRLHVEPSAGGPDGLWLQLHTRPKMTIGPGAQAVVQLGYDCRRASSERLSGTLFAAVEPAGPVFEVPVLCEPQSDPGDSVSLAASVSSSRLRPQPPVMASKSFLLWSGVSVGSFEKQRLHLSNTTGQPLNASLCVEALDDRGVKDSSEAREVFFLVHPKSGSACRLLRLDLQPSGDTSIRVAFRPNQPRFARARLLIRLVSHKTTFIVGLRGYGGRGQLLCASGDTTPDGGLVVSSSARHLVLYNRGDRCVWAEAVMPDGRCTVHPRSFLVPASSSKMILLRPTEGPYATASDSALCIRFGDEILRRALHRSHAASWPAKLEDSSGSMGVESLPPDDVSLSWHQTLPEQPRELTVRLTDRSTRTGNGPSLLDDTADLSGLDVPLRETMVRVGHWSPSGEEFSPPKLSPPSTKVQPSRPVRPKPHVEEWLRHQQELTASQLTSTTTFGKSLLRMLSPAEVEFTLVDGRQERSLEWLNVSPWPVSWRLTAAGPLRCEGSRCSSLCSGASSSFIADCSPFAFSPISGEGLGPSAVQRVLLSCSGATAIRPSCACSGVRRQQWHLTANAVEAEDEGDSTGGRRSESHALLLTLRCRGRPGSPSREAPKSKLLIRLREVRFPLSRVHARVEERLKITNRSAQPVSVLFRALPDPFRLGDRAPSQLVLKAAHCVMLPIVFRPSETGRFQAVLAVECPEEAGEAPIRVLLTGEAEL